MNGFRETVCALTGDNPHNCASTTKTGVDTQSTSKNYNAIR